MILKPEMRDVHYQREREREDYSSDYFEYDRQAPSPTDQARYSFDRNYSSRNDRYSREERYAIKENNLINIILFTVIY